MCLYSYNIGKSFKTISKVIEAMKTNENCKNSEYFNIHSGGAAFCCKDTDSNTDIINDKDFTMFET